MFLLLLITIINSPEAYTIMYICIIRYTIMLIYTSMSLDSLILLYSIYYYYD